MDAVDVVIGGFLALVMVLITLLIWGSAIAAWRDLKTPPKPHDPAWYFSRRMWSWEYAPESVRDWLRGGYGPRDGATIDGVVIAEVTAVLDGTMSDPELDRVDACLRVALPDGTETYLHTEAADETSVRPGAYLPVRPRPEGDNNAHGDTWQPASDLGAEQVARLLIEHRRNLGLVDGDLIPALLAGNPETVDHHGLRPTGRVRAGHVEIEVDIEVELATGSEAATVTGFLRPEDVATVRHTGQVRAVRTPEGRWLLWPTWH